MPIREPNDELNAFLRKWDDVALNQAQKRRNEIISSIFKDKEKVKMTQRGINDAVDILSRPTIEKIRQRREATVNGIYNHPIVQNGIRGLQNLGRLLDYRNYTHRPPLPEPARYGGYNPQIEYGDPVLNSLNRRTSLPYPWRKRMGDIIPNPPLSLTDTLLYRPSPPRPIMDARVRRKYHRSPVGPPPVLSEREEEQQPVPQPQPVLQPKPINQPTPFTSAENDVVSDWYAGGDEYPLEEQLNHGGEYDPGWEYAKQFIPIESERNIENPLLTLRKAMSAATGVDYSYGNNDAPLSFLDLVTVNRNPWRKGEYDEKRHAYPSRYYAAAKLYADAGSDKNLIPPQLIPWMYEHYGPEKTRRLIQRVTAGFKANRGTMKEVARIALRPNDQKRLLLKFRGDIANHPYQYGIGTLLTDQPEIFLPPGYLSTEDVSPEELQRNDAWYTYLGSKAGKSMHADTNAFLDPETRKIYIGKHETYPLTGFHEFGHGRGGSWLNKYQIRNFLHNLKRRWNVQVMKKPEPEYAHNWDNIREELAATLSGADAGFRTTQGLHQSDDLRYILDNPTKIFNLMGAPQWYTSEYVTSRLYEMLKDEEARREQIKKNKEIDAEIDEEIGGGKSIEKAKAGITSYPGMPW